MGYTLLKNLTAREEGDTNMPSGSNSEPYHYLRDVSAVLNQPNANSSINVVRVRSTGSTKEYFWVRVAVVVGSDGQILSRLDTQGHIGALPCPPYNEYEEGKYFDESFK